MMMQQNQKQICRRKIKFNIKKKFLWRISVLRRYIRSVWSGFVACWRGNTSPLKYRHFPTGAAASAAIASSPSSSSPPADAVSLPCCSCLDHTKDSSDLVPLKISLFGDPHVGKTSFLKKYAGEKKGEELTVTGINHVDKTLYVKGARISYSIWEVGGDQYSSLDYVPKASKDSVAMLFMFDLTSRCTLNSVIGWYQAARKYNQTAIPVIIGTKFDDFIQLPIDLQWTIASQARAYAKAANATLFFSSAKYNINVNKIFKFITAKLFNLSWNLERNLTIGEPIIDF